VKKLELSKRIEKALRIDPSKTEQKLVAFVRKKVKAAGATGTVVGLSGGLDSSVVVALCAKALGGKNVIGVSLPEAGVTSPHDVADAREIANRFGVRFKVVDITPAMAGIRKNLTDYRVGALLPTANLRPRVRMVILYYYANLTNKLVVGTGNRSELRSGYFTKWGDGAADLLPLGRIYKTQVKQLAYHLKLPKHLIEKKPSAGLWRGQTDEKELGITYEKLDMIYAGLDLKLKPASIAKAIGVNINTVKNFIERERKTSHKLAPPEMPKL